MESNQRSSQTNSGLLKMQFFENPVGNHNTDGRIEQGKYLNVFKCQLFTDSQDNIETDEQSRKDMVHRRMVIRKHLIRTEIGKMFEFTQIFNISKMTCIYRGVIQGRKGTFIMLSVIYTGKNHIKTPKNYTGENNKKYFIFFIQQFFDVTDI